MTLSPEFSDQERSSLIKIVSLLSGVPVEDLQGRTIQQLYQMWNEAIL